MTDNSSVPDSPSGDDGGASITIRAARSTGSWPPARTLIRHPWVRAADDSTSRTIATSTIREAMASGGDVVASEGTADRKAA